MYIQIESQTGENHINSSRPQTYMHMERYNSNALVVKPRIWAVHEHGNKSNSGGKSGHFPSSQGFPRKPAPSVGIHGGLGGGNYEQSVGAGHR